MTQGVIVFLNGASSAGKTSIALALQDLFDEPYLLVGLDSALSILPERFRTFENPDNHKAIRAAISGAHHGIAALASTNNNVIVDHILSEEHEFIECVLLLSHFTVFFVGVHCELHELEKREAMRNHKMGVVKSQLESVHALGVYDIEVDTTHIGTQSCAIEIKKKVESGISPTAFRKILDQICLDKTS
ncbi:MAG: chloramphenicol phosphotransferase [Candidatus Latescibacteria bacterium]|nr:chloramphenicol phosphotransferase [Candidatus Latescibacterota bacterium]